MKKHNIFVIRKKFTETDTGEAGGTYFPTFSKYGSRNLSKFA